MSSSVFKNIKYSSWLDEYNFDNCKLNRKEYGQFICDYLSNENDGFVLNLNGSWGSGKTEFLKRLYSECINRGNPTIYIDAWESDFSEDPLTVVSCELTQQIELINKNLIDNPTFKKLHEFIGKSFKAGLTTVASLASKKILNDYSVGAEFINKFYEENPESLLEKLKENYTDRVESISKIRSQLSYLASDLESSFGSNLPVVVLIDELDRCRPTYAVEMLEVIKHFFKTRHFVFVVATDTEQLAHSINAIYGLNFNSKQYLKRFFDRTAQLPPPDIKSYLNNTNILQNIDRNKVTLFPLNEDSFSIQNQIMYTAIAFGLEIRDIDQLIYKLIACLRHAMEIQKRTQKHQIINVSALIIGIAEYDKDHDSYHKRNNNTDALLGTTTPVKLADDLTFQDIANVCLKTTTLKRYTFENVTSNRIVNFKDIPEANYNQSAIKQNIYSQLSQVIISIGNKNSSNPITIKYWLWDDYKNIIELAGHLN